MPRLCNILSAKCAQDHPSCYKGLVPIWRTKYLSLVLALSFVPTLPEGAFLGVCVFKQIFRFSHMLQNITYLVPFLACFPEKCHMCFCAACGGAERVDGSDDCSQQRAQGHCGVPHAKWSRRQPSRKGWTEKCWNAEKDQYKTKETRVNWTGCTIINLWWM